MNIYEKAAIQLRRLDVDASTSMNINGSSLLVNVGDDSYLKVELSLREVKKWAELYDDQEVMEIRKQDPRYLLGEIAKIFHTHGWVLHDGDVEPEVIEANERFLELIYKAFKPQKN